MRCLWIMKKRIHVFFSLFAFWSNTEWDVNSRLFNSSVYERFFFSVRSYNHYQPYLWLYFDQSTHNPISIWFFFIFFIHESIRWIHVSSIFTIPIDSASNGMNLAFYRELVFTTGKLLCYFSSLALAMCLIQSNINILLSSRKCYVNFFFAFVCMRFVFSCNPLHCMLRSFD